MKTPKPLTTAQLTTPRGAQLQTKENFLYGRFETMMKPAFGSGIVSSFFTFYDGSDFRTNWNEIDFEFLGRNTNSLDLNFIRTVAGVTDKNTNVTHPTVSRRSSDVFWKLCIEWLPWSVIWKVNDVVVRVANVNLDHPQKLMMNIWIGNPVWAGLFDRGLLPQVATYEYVRVSSWDGEFKLKWQDDFTKLDETRWLAAAWQLESTVLVRENIQVDGQLKLKLI